MTKAITISKDTMTIDQALEALNYTPDADKWAAKDEPAKWSEITKKKNEREVKTARKTLNTFATSDDAAKLPKEVVAAMLRLAPTRAQRTAGTGSANPFMDNMRELFPKVGTVVTGIDVYLATKLGSAGMKGKVRQNLKSSAPEARMWLQISTVVDEKTGKDIDVWTLLAIGEKQPKGWESKAIDTKA